jgi:hypothetical protein
MAPCLLLFGSMRNQVPGEPHPGHDRQRPERALDPDDREPDDDEGRIARAHPRDAEGDEIEDDYTGVAQRPNRSPAREREDAEVALEDLDDVDDDDIMEELDDDDLTKMEGPDA